MAEIRINATGGVKLYDADDSHYAQIVAGTITSNVDLLTLNSAGITVLDGAIDFDIASHDTSNGLKLGGTLVTATAAELNIMDGVTATAAELNIMDGVTATAAELNIMDGVTSTAAEINLIDGGTARGTTALADGDGILINDGGTMRMTNVTTVKTYMTGEILQVVSGSYATAQTISAGTNTAAGFSVALTPSATSSDILILWSGNQRASVASATSVYAGTSIWGDIGGAGYNNLGGGSGDYQDYVHGFTGVDAGERAIIGPFSRNTVWSPNTTSACTVKIYHKGASAIQYSATKSEIVLLEIAG